jgi:selenocysteine lyase/cysteine desulfurase
LIQPTGIPPNRFVWQSLAAQGVEFRQLDLSQCPDEPEQALLALCDAHTRLISISAVQYTNGWHMAEGLTDYSMEHYQPARTARRFECGSPNMLGIHALHASLGLLLETGMDNNTLFQRLQEQGVFCALRGGGVRLSPHFYTPMQQLEQVLEIIGT